MMRFERMAAFGGALALSLVPHTVSAATFKEIVEGFFVPLGDLVMALLYALAFLAFLVGVVRFLAAGGSSEGRQKGKQLMVWGIIGLVVLFGIWGLVKFFISVLTTWA